MGKSVTTVPLEKLPQNLYPAIPIPISVAEVGHMTIPTCKRWSFSFLASSLEESREKGAVSLPHLGLKETLGNSVTLSFCLKQDYSLNIILSIRVCSEYWNTEKCLLPLLPFTAEQNRESSFSKQMPCELLHWGSNLSSQQQRWLFFLITIASHLVMWAVGVFI